MMKDENEWRGVGNHEYLFIIADEGNDEKKKRRRRRTVPASATCQLRVRSSIVHQGITIRRKVLTYVEYRAVSGVFQNFDPPPPFQFHPPPHPRRGGGGVHTRRAVRGQYLEDARRLLLGLASYSIISLRNKMSSIFADQ
jgi:hypothetical protein